MGRQLLTPAALLLYALYLHVQDLPMMCSLFLQRSAQQGEVEGVHMSDGSQKSPTLLYEFLHSEATSEEMSLGNLRKE